MEETVKQKKVAGVVQQTLSEILQKENLSIINGISISPNPAKDVLYVNSSAKEFNKVSYTIYSVKGQLVKSGDILLNNKESVSISDLASGVYEIKFSINQSNSVYKFIKE